MKDILVSLGVIFAALAVAAIVGPLLTPPPIHSSNLPKNTQWGVCQELGQPGTTDHRIDCISYNNSTDAMTYVVNVFLQNQQGLLKNDPAGDWKRTLTLQCNNQGPFVMPDIQTWLSGICPASSKN